MKKVLICESEEVLLTAIEFRLQKQKLEVIVCKSAKDIEQYLSDNKPDLMVLDFDLHDFEGTQQIAKIRKNGHAELPMLLIADLEYEDMLIHSFSLGVDDFVTKPFKPNELILRIRRLLDEL